MAKTAMILTNVLMITAAAQMAVSTLHQDVPAHAQKDTLWTPMVPHAFPTLASTQPSLVHTHASTFQASTESKVNSDTSANATQDTFWNSMDTTAQKSTNALSTTVAARTLASTLTVDSTAHAQKDTSSVPMARPAPSSATPASTPSPTKSAAKPLNAHTVPTLALLQ